MIMDMNMPELSGEDALREIKRLVPKLPVVLASGYSESGAIEDLPATGAAAFLMKPFAAEELARLVRRLLA